MISVSKSGETPIRIEIECKDNYKIRFCHFFSSSLHNHFFNRSPPPFFACS